MMIGTTFVMDEHLYEQLRNEAHSRRISQGSILRDAVIRYFSGRNEK